MDSAIRFSVLKSVCSRLSYNVKTFVNLVIVPLLELFLVAEKWRNIEPFKSVFSNLGNLGHAADQDAAIHGVKCN